VSCRPDGQAGARSRAFLYGAVLDGPTGIEDRVFTGPLLFGVLQRAQPKFKPAIKNDKLRHHVSVTAEFDDYRALVAWGQAGRLRRAGAGRGIRCARDPCTMADMTLGEAAKAIGVSVDTLRRWDRAGKIVTTRDAGNRRRVPPSEVQRLQGSPTRHETGDTLSARNRFPGVVRSIEVDGVMGLIEIQAGPFLVTAAVTRDAVDELGLVEGAPATATVKATSVMIERGVR